MNNQKELIIDKIEKNFSYPLKQGNLKVLEDVSLYMEVGEIIALLGPSGCGKSTLLNIVAGFEKPDKGQVVFMGKTVIAPSPERAVVFQSATLFPWLTAKQNIAYGLKLHKQKQEVIKEKCKKYIELVGLQGFENYYPAQLSGGMQQRVALARVLVLEPRMLLMDEPFAALDAQTRIKMQQLLLSISAQIKPTILFVTHDVEEALILADKVYVMSKLPGRIIRQVEVPFKRPRSISIIGTNGFSKTKREILQLLFE
ncbi:ABC transporter ATP-binding protein [Clostridium formicaceticum]|uniref:ABC transporter ATP-binding protein n=1 Tax=Clostridium formicaceticum TaxID=1497 RepID=A0AAC9RNH5_9CLOT|nr:ABC transporter ATP-binding protein [Clostridium formicaceticum]AOY77798.1 ABC transporter ATP-binding protein [Clostridium formicaceticum]ARE88405.1 Bicarbonate transport ATP-binding protein CmpD [Clostridium formicaceticum]